MNTIETEIQGTGITTIIPDTESEGKYSDYIAVVSKLTYFYQNVMSPRTIEKLTSYFQKGHSVLLLENKSSIFLAHAAIKWVSSINPLLEIGTVVVNPQYQGNGLGTKVVQATIDWANKKYPGYLQFAFCNLQSLNIFKKLGAVDAAIDDLPTE